ncbi:PepSY domain-containing protein [Aquimarina sp. I32.4]|uniref:PepSY domain-containing protein n=1 Tax=Aquimarina sp. I32.4 TaxID=2053903 RepID=UPI000CDECE94|nr:PepSY domain-containing protein [Aquimarina sp. I32.4]
MTISIWRYSHLALAISSFIFLLLVSITGGVLALEPILEKSHPYSVKNASQLTIAQTINIVKKNYDEVISIKRDKNGFILLEATTTSGNNTFYINPFTGKKIGDIIKQKAIFKFMTNLHRSLFLKSLGRIFIGITSFLLFLITISGVFLIIKRQNGIKKFLSKVIKENASQYFHIIFGRLTLIPIIILSLTGAYLSLLRFEIIPNKKIELVTDQYSSTNDRKIQPIHFPVFKNISLSEVRELTFPFFEDEEEYYHLKLKDKEAYIHQFTGAIVSEQKYPFSALLSNLSLNLHTGKGSIIWSLIIGISTLCIPYFIYSGFVMTLKRRKKSKVLKNNFHKDKAEYIILVGSETGNTFELARLFYNALIDLGKTVFITELNAYTSYKKAEHIIIFTATYGKGEPPANAKKFKRSFAKITPIKEIHFSVVGLGSLAYPDFCKYAIDIDHMLQSHPKFIPVTGIHKINNQSFEAFKTWSSKWSKNTGLPIQVSPPKRNIDIKKHQQFLVIERSSLNIDDTFLLRLRPEKKTQFTSGDLLAFYPKSDSIERLYSIGKIDGDILLSIKKHKYGICSTYFSQLIENDTITALIRSNPHFNVPKRTKGMVMIANGTGIAPFLGMINENHNNAQATLFWGGRNEESKTLYNPIIQEGLDNRTLHSFFPAYSRVHQEKIYVQHIVEKNAPLIASTLHKKGIVFICGSIIMQKDVLYVIDQICLQINGKPLSYYQNKGQLKMDCY